MRKKWLSVLLAAVLSLSGAEAFVSLTGAAAVEGVKEAGTGSTDTGSGEGSGSMNTGEDDTDIGESPGEGNSSSVLSPEPLTDEEDSPSGMGDDSQGSSDSAPENGETADSGDDGQDSFQSSEDETDWSIAIFTDENADQLQGETREDEELVDAVEEGEVIGFAPVYGEALTTAAYSVSSGESEASVAALSEGEYYVENQGRLYCDEVWTYANDFVEGGNYTRMSGFYRLIHYVDADGAQRTAPLYCMNATKTGLGSVSLKEEAVQALSGSTLKKILYFGYGGPGDICGSYDPTCSHIDWSNAVNRYIFTHLALSKEYSGDVGYATDAEVEHVGLNKFITQIKSLTIPSRTAAKLSVNTASGWVTAKNATAVFSLFRSAPASLSYVPDTYTDGFQVTSLIKVVDEAGAGNGIKVTRPSGADWQLVYWTSSAKYQENKTSPEFMGTGSLTMKSGYVFRLIFPPDFTAQKFTFNMLLQPVSYLLVDGSTQTGNSGSQDFGAYVYQGTRGQVTLTLTPASSGELIVTKTASHTGEVIPGVQYTLYAAEALKSGALTVWKKDEEVETLTADSSGKLTFTRLVPGAYYLKETATVDGYRLSTEEISVTITAGKTTSAAVTDTPDISGSISIEKIAAGTSRRLSGAEFTLYAWDASKNAYESVGTKLVYDSESERYVSGTFVYTEANQGKFKVMETASPPGYTGSWYKELALTEAGTCQVFEYTVENTLLEEKILQIRKTDSETGADLVGAEFTLYEYSQAVGDYKSEGTILTYNGETLRYESAALEITEDNQGRYKVTETRCPDDYTGAWEKEIDLSEEDAQLQYTVENTPVEQPRGMVYIKKRDSCTGENLEGAVFALWQWNAESSAYEDTLGELSVLTYHKEDQMYHSRELLLTDQNAGKFKVIETENPEGYYGSWEKELVFVIEDPSQIAEIRLEVDNEPSVLPVGEISIVKKIREEDIVWAHGDPVFQFVAEGVDARGNSRKYEDFIAFVRDNYEVDTEGYAMVSLTFSDVPLGEYRIYEKTVLRYYLKEILANTGNVTITRLNAPAPGLQPAETAYGTAVLSMAQDTASITFVNEKYRYDGYSHTDVIKNTVPVVWGEALAG
ncbi:MAG: hypothetical protein LUF78_04940 [Clostridiales bacterium]|nr:hypothetical protein [Clostridiales bacterium]